MTLEKNSTIEKMIDSIIHHLSNLFGLSGITWEYAIVDENTPKNLLQSILTAYDSKSKSIIINPCISQILEQQGYSEEITIFLILSNVAHELRHAWQYTQEEFKKSLAEGITYGNMGLEYVQGYHEIDAYAFQEAFLKYIFEDKDFKLDISKSIPSKVVKLIHDRANELITLF